MMGKIRYVWVMLCLLCFALLTSAQDDPQIYTFESGVQFTVPANGTVDDSGGLPVVNLDDAVLIDVVGPTIIGQTPDATLNMPLGDVLDFLLSAVGYEETRADDQTISMNLLDGREVLAYNFINSSEANQLIFVIRLSDGRIGALNIRSLDSLTQEQVTTIGEIANSLDLRTASNDPVLSDREAELTAGLSQLFAYESGVNFRYPENFLLVNEDDPPVTIGIDEELVMTMVDPNQVGIPAGETMGSIIEFAIGSSDLSAGDFEPFDIGGRDAVIGTIAGEEIFESMVIVKFADQTYGIIDILTVTEPTDEHIELIRSVTASFNSATSEVGVTRADMDEARSLFENAMAVRDEGDNETAIDLFTQAIDLNPELALAYYWRGATYQFTGELENAIADYRQALSLEPDQLQIQEDIANMYALLGDLESAVAELSSYIDAAGKDNVDPQILELLEIYQAVADGEFNEDFYFSRANRLREVGLFEEALASNQVSIDNDPTDAEHFSQRGVIYVDMEDYESAIDAFTDGLEVEIMPILFYNRGVAHRGNSPLDLDSMIAGVHDFQCLLLLADDTITQEQIDYADNAITMTLISSDDYEPITDSANCVP